jgi:fatty acid desaturase
MRVTLFKAPRIAWGTVALFAGLFLAWGTGLVGGVSGWLPAPVAVALCSVGAYAAFTVMHDASHHVVARSHGLNSLLGHTSASILLARFIGFQSVHRRHHRFAGDRARDPDRYSGEGPGWQLPWRWATADIHYYFEYDPHEPLSPREARDSQVSAWVMGVCIAALCLSGHVTGFLLFWVLPARIALFFSTYSFDYVPHQRPHCRSSSEDRFQASFVIEGRLMTVLLLCQNYHLVHHLYPAVPFYRYPAIWRAFREELRARGATTVKLFERPRPLEERVGAVRAGP